MRLYTSVILRLELCDHTELSSLNSDRNASGEIIFVCLFKSVRYRKNSHTCNSSIIHKRVLVEELGMLYPQFYAVLPITDMEMNL